MNFGDGLIILVNCLLLFFCGFVVGSNFIGSECCWIICAGMEDISLLAEYYLKLFSERYSKNIIHLQEDAIQKLMTYHWPGNIRELAHAIERAVILSKKESLTSDDFVLKIKAVTSQPVDRPVVRVEDFERIAISNAMSKHSGNLSKAATELGIARSTLYRKIAHLGIENGIQTL